MRDGTRDGLRARERARRGALERGLVAVVVHGTTYALPIDKVQEIVLPAKPTPLPQAPLGVIGAVDHRGDVVPLLDLALRLGYGPTEGERRKWILFRDRGRGIGLVVERVLEVFRVNVDDVRPAPTLGHPELRGSTEVVTFQGAMAFVLELPVLYRAAEVVFEESESA